MMSLIKHCKCCNKPVTNKANIFCNKSCAATFNNTQMPKRIKQLKIKLPPIIRPKISKPAKIYTCKACGMNHSTCADKLKCQCNLSTKVQTFKNLNKYFNLSLEFVGTSKFLFDFNECREYAMSLYEKHSLPSLAQYLGHPDTTGGNIGKLLSYLNINLNTQSIAQQKSLVQNRRHLPHNYKFKSGWLFHQDKKYFYRSSYELNFANHLISNNIDFDMESLRIPYFDTLLNKNRIALPDFIINNIIVEIKGDYTFNEQNMIDKFLKYIELGYEPYLILEGKTMVLDQGIGPLTPTYKEGVIPLNYSS